MVEFRAFRNGDTPQLLRLFLDAQLGRGAARPESYHALEIACGSLPYFDRQGLIVATDSHRIVGFVHAGFGFDSQGAELDRTRGVICLIVVAPEFRRQGIGRELIARAEGYLHNAGTNSIQAGQSRGCDPFYFGIYGGARNSGFLTTDTIAQPFFQSLGYSPAEINSVFRRPIEGVSTMNFRYMQLRRKSEIMVSEQPHSVSRRWLCHFGNIESMNFELVDRRIHSRIASLTVVGLDNYITTWNERSIGLVDIFVEEPYRGQGYSQVLIVEAIRKLKTDMISAAEVHVPNANEAAIAAVTGAGFKAIDTGIVYRK